MNGGRAEPDDCQVLEVGCLGEWWSRGWRWNRFGSLVGGNEVLGLETGLSEVLMAGWELSKREVCRPARIAYSNLGIGSRNTTLPDLRKISQEIRKKYYNPPVKTEVQQFTFVL